MEEKGRRFGKFNIIDILILLIIVAGVVFLAVKLTGSRSLGEESYTRIEYTVWVGEVPAQVCETVMGYKKANVQLMANGEMVDGYVTDITYGPHITYEANADGVIVTAEEQGEHARKDMVFTIQATVASTVTNKVGTQEVRIGKSHVVKTTEFEMEGYPTKTLTREVIE